jgi:sarcosine oxidase delta subunit
MLHWAVDLAIKYYIAENRQGVSVEAMWHARGCDKYIRN